MSKEISIESLYANGMGIELPISNNDNVIKQESYDCSNIIDLQSIENDLNYLNTYELLEKHNTNDMIKLHNKLNKEYGKHNKSLESYLDTRIKSLEENKLAMAGKKIWEWLKMMFSKISELFKIIIRKYKAEFNAYATLFKLLGITVNSKVKYESKKNVSMETSMILKNFDIKKNIDVLNNFNNLYHEFIGIFSLFLSVKSTNIEAFKKEITTLEKSYSGKVDPFKRKLSSFLSKYLKLSISSFGQDDNVENLKSIQNISYEDVMMNSCGVKIINKTEIPIKDIYKDYKQFFSIIIMNTELYSFIMKINESMTNLSKDYDEFVITIGKQLKSAEPGSFNDNKIFKHVIELSHMFILLTRKLMSGSKEVCETVKNTCNIIKLKEPEPVRVV